MTKVTTENFSMDRKKDGMGNLSVAARRVTAENAPISDFCEIRKVPSRLLAVPPKKAQKPELLCPFSPNGKDYL